MRAAARGPRSQGSPRACCAAVAIECGNDGQRRQVKQVSSGVSGARGGAVLPAARAPAIVASSAAGAAQADALLVMVTYPVARGAFTSLPESARWRQLDARAPATPGSVRATTLGNQRQTLAVLGYVRADASPFERLTLAGRMVREAAARNPRERRALLTGHGRRGARLARSAACGGARAGVRSAELPCAGAGRAAGAAPAAGERCGRRHALRRSRRPRHESHALAHRAPAQHARRARLPARDSRACAPPSPRPALAGRVGAAPRRRRGLPRRGAPATRCAAPASHT